MTEQELRALVRETVARNLAPRTSQEHLAPRTSHLAPAGHPSHAQYLTLINVGEACLIEPSVECTHCGYCKSHGH